jgi:hypothetical protein
MLGGRTATHLFYLLVHDPELSVIDDERNQQAGNADYLSDNLKVLKRAHFLHFWSLLTF